MDLATAVNCADAGTAAQCLRSKSAQELLEALPLKAGVIFGNGADWGPIQDGEVLTEPSQATILQQGASVPVIFGSNANEGDLFVLLAGLGAIGVPAYQTIAATFAAGLGIPAQDLLDQYPAAAYPTPADALSAAIGDAAFVCPMRRAVRGVTANGGKAYLYHFTREITLLGITKSFHGAELPFVFDKPLSTFTPDSSEDAALSQAMQGYWTGFASSADPGGAVTWPVYAEAQDQHLTLDHQIEVGSALNKDKCDFWDGVGS
jgi:para-nitrobenzyl esterase